MRSRLLSLSFVPGRVATAMAAGALAAMASGGCAASLHDNSSNSYVIVDALLAASGATPTLFGGVLGSDVLSMVSRTVNGVQVTVPTVIEDLGSVSFRLGLRDPGTAASPTSPSTRNAVTITHYHVSYVRADGRNTPGVDVPFPIDSAMTVTVGDTVVSASFIIVQAAAKTQMPLVSLVGTNTELATVAEVTFSGTDQSGRAVSVTAQIGINFADWGG
jgi:hypothetical protein